MTSVSKRPGRPRRDPRPLQHPPDEEILRAAARLFAAKGFAGTSTREIAQAAGLRQPSLFHYYPTKEDILRALSERALMGPLAALETIAASDAPASVRLYLVVTVHVRHMCSQPFDLAAVLEDAWRLPRSRFRKWFAQADRYAHGVRDLVEEGQAAGSFIRDAHPGAVTMAILGMANWTIRWFRPDGELTADQVADEFARFTLRGLLVGGTEPADVAAQARALEEKLAIRALTAGEAPGGQTSSRTSPR